MKIDGNELCKLDLKMGREGKPEEGLKFKLEFLQKVKESGMDHCNCPEACRHHGNCYECVIIHRGHRDHLPYCMWDMTNERIQNLSLLTEDSYMKKNTEICYCDDCCEKDLKDTNTNE